MENKHDIISISDEELKSINSAICTRYGVDFSEYEPTSLKRRIVRIIHKFDLEGIFGLWKKILYDPDFVHTFRDEISVGLTEMFRNPDLWMYMRDDLLKSKKNDLAIWHAGISTGEEVFSMSILLHEMNILNNSQLLATDLSSKFVDIAKKGVVESDQLKKYENNYLTFNPKGSFKNYIESDGAEHKIKKEMLTNANFQQHNVLASGPSGKYDLILCRNVMIYFSDELKMKTLNKFADHLKDDGLLIIGYFDSMPDKFNNFFNYHNHGFKIFKKK